MSANFSYIWVYIIFILQAFSCGIYLSRIGEEKKTQYTLGSFFFSLLMFIMTGLSLHLWE